MRNIIIGVRELFEQEPPPPPRKTRAEMMKDIDADYYGYMDDDDGILIPLETNTEKLCMFLKRITVLLNNNNNLKIILS